MNMLSVLPRYRQRMHLLTTVAGGSLGPLLVTYITTRMLLDGLAPGALVRACDQALLLLAALVVFGLLLLSLLTRSLTSRQFSPGDNRDRPRHLFIRLAWLQPLLLATSTLGGLVSLVVVILVHPWKNSTAVGNVFLLLSLYLPAAGTGAVMSAGRPIYSLLALLDLTEVHGPRLGLRPRAVLWTLLASIFACGLALLLYTTALLGLPAATAVPPGQTEVITETVAWVLFFSALVGWFLGQEMQAAVSQLRAQLQRVGSSQLLERLPLPAATEVSGAAAAFNRLADRLEASHQRLENFTERVRRTEKMQKRFLAGVSHELRTPLNGIIGYADLLSGGFEGKLTPQQSKAVQIIEQEGERLLTLINDILLLARLESGRERTEPEQLALASLPDSFREQQPQSAAVDWYLDEGSTGNMVLIDVTRLNQAIGRLLKILASAGDNQPVRGDIRTTGNGYFILELTAAGFQPPTGMEQHTAWRPFSRPARYGGAGLDLPVAAGLVQLLGGSVEFISRPGSAGVRIRLPCRPPAEQT